VAFLVIRNVNFYIRDIGDVKWWRLPVDAAPCPPINAVGIKGVNFSQYHLEGVGEMTICDADGVVVLARSTVQR
jgi:hypothetical protein